MKNKMIIAGACSAFAALAVTSTAHAIGTDELRYSINGADWVTVMDISGSGAISVMINSGGFNGSINLLAGVNNGTTSSPSMDLTLLLNTTAGAGNILVEYSDINFSPAHGYTLSDNANQLLTTGTISTAAFVGPNTIFAGTDPLHPSTFPPSILPPNGVIGPIGAGQTASGAFLGQSDPYSLTLAASYTAPSSGLGFISDDIGLKAPDGGSTLLMLGSALSILGFCAFRRKAVKA